MNARHAAEALTDRHRVGERLERVGRIGQAVDDRDRRVRRELLDLGLVERADHDRAEEPREHERGVAGRLAPRELEVGGGHVEGHAAELRDPDLRADPGARRRLAEDEADGAAGEDAQLLAPCPLDLQLVGEVEREEQLVAGSTPRRGCSSVPSACRGSRCPPRSDATSTRDSRSGQSSARRLGPLESRHVSLHGCPQRADRRTSSARRSSTSRSPSTTTRRRCRSSPRTSTARRSRSGTTR